MTSFKGELVVLTPLKNEPGHFRSKIHREETIQAEKVRHIAGGSNLGIVIYDLDPKATIDAEPSYQLPYNVSLRNKKEDLDVQSQEKRTLSFYLRENHSDNSRTVVHKFLKALLTNMPNDYAGFKSRIMSLMLHDYFEIKAIVIDYLILKEEEKIVIPDATQYDSGSELEEVTAGHVQETLEHAFPNGLTTATISECLRCEESEVLNYLKELEASGVVRQVDNEWIRVDTRRVDENIEANRQASTSAGTPTSEQPTVAIISCLFVEKQAVDSLIEESSTIHKYKSGGDSNVYTIGRIGPHRVVATKLALIGDSREAITSAGSITTRLLGNFQNIEHVFIVGIGGAVPHFVDASLHARLGDVIISASRPKQYVYAHDLLIDRKTEQITGFAVRDWDASDRTIEQIVENGGESLIEKWNKSTQDAIETLTSGIGSNDVEWKSPPESTDVLAYTISPGNVAVLPHPVSNRSGPQIHLGTIGALASLKKYDSIGSEESSINEIRERFAESFKVRCMDVGFDSVVGAIVGSCVKSWALIRGIADYQHGQSRAAKTWQPHAAVRAAGMVRCIIEQLPTDK